MSSITRRNKLQTLKIKYKDKLGVSKNIARKFMQMGV